MSITTILARKAQHIFLHSFHYQRFIFSLGTRCGAFVCWACDSQRKGQHVNPNDVGRHCVSADSSQGAAVCVWMFPKGLWQYHWQTWIRKCWTYSSCSMVIVTGKNLIYPFYGEFLAWYSTSGRSCLQAHKVNKQMTLSKMHRHLAQITEAILWRYWLHQYFHFQ